MPELPEVDNVRRQLHDGLHLPLCLDKLEFSKESLRFPVQKNKIKKTLEGKTFLNISRHGKYLFMMWENGVLVSHLGMTGHWRIEGRKFEKRKHDHLIFHFGDQVLIFNDPRRFGFIIWQPQVDLKKLNLGPDAMEWNLDKEFFLRMKKKKAPIKSVLLDQKVVAGIGNIYASEILFFAGVKPLKHAARLSEDDWNRVLKETKRVLQTSIDMGGSSIDDYLHPDGNPGGYQAKHAVYGKEKQPCPQCKSAILLSTLSGRSTYWCRHCQK